MERPQHQFWHENEILQWLCPLHLPMQRMDMDRQFMERADTAEII